KRTWLRISDHELAWLALPLLFLLSEHPYCARPGRPGLFTTVDCGSFSSFWRVVWLTSSSRVDSAMRGSSISFLTRASVAWLDSCFGSFLCILARCHESKGITGQFGTGLAEMMHCPWVLPGRVDPRLEDLKDKQIVFDNHPCINDFAFEIGIAFSDQRRLHTGNGRRCEMKDTELVNSSPRGVPAAPPVPPAPPSGC